MAGDKVPTWVVTGQRPDFRPGPDGNYAEGVLVSFRTASGAIGSVFFPEAMYSAAAVKQAIDAKASAMEAVAGLQGS